MKKQVHSFRTGLLVLITLFYISAHAQDDLCTGVEKLMKSSYKKFSDIPDAFQLTGFGKGVKQTTGFFYYAKWTNESSYPSYNEALAKYTELAAKLTDCRIAGKPFSRTVTDKERLRQIDAMVFDTWNMPKDADLGKVEIEIEIKKQKNTYSLSFVLTNRDNAKEIDSRIAKAIELMNEKEGFKTKTLSFYDAVMKVIESGPDFPNVKGRAIGDGEYESLIQVIGGIKPRVYQPGLGPEGWLVDLISTTDKGEATRKYNEIAQQLGANDKWSIGTVKKDETEDAIGKTTTWEPVSLNNAYEKSHVDFAMDLVLSKNFRGQYEVYLKIRYDN